MKTFVIKYQNNLEVREELVRGENQPQAIKNFSKSNPDYKIKEVKEHTGEPLLENING